MSEESFVGMEVCFYCLEESGVVTSKDLRKKLLRRAIYNREPCPSCAEYMRQGVILIEVDEEKTEDRNNPYRAGGWVVMSENGVKNCFEEATAKKMLRCRVGFLDRASWKLLGLPTMEDFTENQRKDGMN